MFDKFTAFFEINKSDRRAYLILIFLCFFIVLVRSLIPLFVSAKGNYDFSAYEAEYLAYQERISEDKAYYPYKNYDYKSSKKGKYKRFKFNPNKMTASDAEKLGFSKKTYNNISNHINAGGGFSRKSDLKKIHGMSDELYEQLEPFMELKDDENTSENSIVSSDETDFEKGDLDEKEAENRVNNNEEKFTQKPVKPIDLYSFDPNTVSKNELMAFGVNSKAAYNWEKFRAGGGKFYQQKDVAQIYDLSANELAKISPFLQFPEKPIIEETPVLSVDNTERKEPYPFNPNEITKEALMELGLEKSIANRWVNFRERNPLYTIQDVEKIYGLKNEDLMRLTPFMEFSTPPIVTAEEQQILDEEAKAAEEEMLENEEIETEKAVEINTNIPIIELNSATKEQLIQLPNIKEGRANLILKYRTELGGFAHISQLKNVWQVEQKEVDLWQPYLTINTENIQQININTSTEEELKKHPEIDWQTANSIVKYRNQNGEFTDIKELKRIYTIDKTLFEKLKPYFTL